MSVTVACTHTGEACSGDGRSGEHEVESAEVSDGFFYSLEAKAPLKDIWGSKFTSIPGTGLA